MKNNSRIRVLIADDHELIREGIIALLDSPDIELVGDVSSGEEVVNLLEQRKPDVILMDILMEGMTGIEATRWVKEHNSKCKVILISMEVTKEYLSNGIKCGVDGYLPKTIAKKNLLDAVRTVHNGKTYFPEQIKEIVFDDFASREKLKGPEKIKLPNDLTKREYEVLGHVALGKTNKEIADELFISLKTVESHKTNIFEKMNFKNIAELVKYAVKAKIISI
jgi:DNA-binding NarL/FixJ family response regulator